MTLVLLLLGLRWLPLRRPNVWPGAQTPLAVRLRRGGDLLLAGIGGVGMAALSYAMMTRVPPEGVGRFFLEQAYPGGGGKNVVNVILVDFRSFDTLGEITVLSIVAVTIFSLLRRFRPAAESVEAPDQQKVQNAFDDAGLERERGDTARHYLMVPRVLMEWLFPIIATFALYLLVRGHDWPGGGFAAGVTASIALIILYMAGGTRWVEARLNVQPLVWISAGLVCAVATGAGALLFGAPFLTTYFQYFEVPLAGAVPVASALLFDIGVFMVVVGTTALILIALAHQSIRAPRARPAAGSSPDDSAEGES